MAVPVQQDPDLVSKSEFARLANVSAPRVTQWIEEKKIHGDALVGEGRSAKIRVSVACQQLKRTLDIAQRLGNGIGTRLDLVAPAAPGPVPEADGATLPLQTQAPRSPADPIEDQLRREKLEEIQRKNRIAAKQEAESDGRLTDASLAQQQFGRIAAKTVDLIEGALVTDAAEAIAGQFAISKRDVMQALRVALRKARADIAASLRREAEAMPSTVEFELGGDAATAAEPAAAQDAEAA